MRLRLRIVLTLVAIACILVAPAVYGVLALRELQEIVRDLRTRDAVGSLALGRLTTALGEVEYSERIYLALAAQLPASEVTEARREVDAGMRRVADELMRLQRVGYGPQASAATREWNVLAGAIRREQELIAAGRLDEADRHRAQVVDPGFAAVDQALDPIGEAINRGGAAQVRRAQDVARQAATTTGLALAAALTLTIVIGAWLTRTLLRPIYELQHGMAVVAGGDFEPEIKMDPRRQDELADLARSFATMSRQLLELDRLKAEFVSVASHEIKTPLSVIRGYVSLLLDGIYGELNESQRKTLNAVSDQTDRLTRLAQRLLDISRFEAGGGRLELREIRLRPFLSELAHGFDALALQNQMDFAVQTAEDLPETIVGDPDRLNEVLGNLLSNAFKFTPQGGKICLVAGPAEEGILVEVWDTGVGIPPDKLPKIFEKFYQVENDAQPRSMGSGLGLAIAREVVEAHGGTISAESEVGRGTTFRVVLPLRPPIAHAA
ncbi:MAG TPA: HAMP domain-containing sensor histidine kinase [Longimicrobiaceae bacterium]|nr:HAMP domain-containing sensor histidine kinase [Longimicrobiaceae bacterium]